MKIYTVIASFAAAYFGLASASPLKRSGCVEYIIDCESHHKVVASDTCAILAADYNITISFLLELNPGLSCSALPVGKNICHKARSITTTTVSSCTTTTAPTTTSTTSSSTKTTTSSSTKTTTSSSTKTTTSSSTKTTTSSSTKTTSSTTKTITTTSSTAVPSGDTIAVVQDVDNFCFFLPPPGSNKNIADHEGDAVSFCTSANALSPKALIFPDEFFTFKFYLAAKNVGDYVQVTGQIDDSKYGLKTSDGGGQYDSEGSPPNATCAGYPHFVNLIEPDAHRFCIRCCQVRSDCNFDHSKDGCPVVVPGNYGPGGDAPVSHNIH